MRCNMDNVSFITTKEQDFTNVTCSEFNHSMSSVSFYQEFGESTAYLGIFHIPQYYCFRISYGLTLISCTFGLLRFLDVGPTRILEKEGWRNYIRTTQGMIIVAQIVSKTEILYNIL